MIRWLSKRMNAAVRVPNLTEHGFQALGGRLLPGVNGPACQIMYQNAAGKRLTIYLARDPQGAPKPVRFSDPEETLILPVSSTTFQITRGAGTPRLRTTTQYTGYRRFITGARVVPPPS